MDLQNCTPPKLNERNHHQSLSKRALLILVWPLIIIGITFSNATLAGSYCRVLNECGYATIAEAAAADCSHMAEGGFRCEGVIERSLHSAPCPELDPKVTRYKGCWTHYASYGYEVKLGYYSAISQIHFTGYDEQDNYDPEKQSHCPSDGNPIVIANGNKYQTEVDYQSQSPFGLAFKRVYNSTASSVATDIGLKWRHHYTRRVVFLADHLDALLYGTARIYRSNGQAFTFHNYTHDGWEGDPDVPDTLIENFDSNNNRTGWVYTPTNDIVETYNQTGQLISLQNRAGLTQTLSYDLSVAEGGDGNNNTLDQVSDSFGHRLLFSYDANQRINRMTDPDGQLYQYSYDAAGNLTSITYPDNSSRYYHYENTSLPNHLTGITDEKGIRFASWAYDAQGRGISSEHTGGIDKVTFTYNSDDSVTVTNPLNKQTTYHFKIIHGAKKVTSVTGHASANCEAANKAYTYDLRGYKQTATDWQGNITTYIYDSKGRETRHQYYRKLVTTEWHPAFSLPLKITDDGQITEYSYDSQGRLLSKSHKTQ